MFKEIGPGAAACSLNWVRTARPCSTYWNRCSALPQAAYGLRRVVAVGDGATDLEARQPGGAEIFIG